MKRIKDKTTLFTIYWTVILLVGMVIFVTLYNHPISASTASTLSPSTSDIQLKVTDQASGDAGASTSGSALLQPSVSGNAAVDNSPACSRGDASLQQVQGGACTDQAQAKQLLNQ